MASKRLTSSYQGFAKVYDEMMADRDYRRWAAYVSALAEDYGVKPPGKILDLACGTGNFLKEMASQGWSAYGVDNSADMLSVAYDKLTRNGCRFTLLEQDMRELDLQDRFPLITCMCDSLNYLIHPADLQTVFEKIRSHLAPGGIFVADMNLELKYRLMLADDSFAETFANSAYIWENSYNSETGICRMEIDFFVRERGELFRHIPEVHLQRSYSQLEIMDLAQKAGFKEVEFWKAFTNERLDPFLEEKELERLESDEGFEFDGTNRYEEGRMFLTLRE